MSDARKCSSAARVALFSIAAIILGTVPALADRVLTKDGRVLTPKKARVEGQGYRLVFENGEILLASKDFVQSVEIEGDMSEYVPQNEDEKQKLEQGYVKYKGKWFSKPGYEDELCKEHEKSKARTDLLALQYSPQIWLNEAVADYFGSSRIERDKKGKITIHPGELQTDRVLNVQQAIRVGGGVLPKTGEPAKGGSSESQPSKGTQTRADTKLEDLFKLKRDEFDGFQYAHAWSFVYFLDNFDNGKYQKAFNKFFKGLYTVEKGVPFEIVNGGGITGRGVQVSPEHIREYLLKKLGLKDTIQLEKDWKTYIAAVPIAGPEARLKRGLYALRGMRFEEALEDLDLAIDGGASDPRAWWARGRARAVTHKPDLAIKDLEKAVEMDPLNAAFRYELPRLRTGRLTLTARGPGGNVATGEDDTARLDHPDAKREAGLATELDPDNERYTRWFQRFQ